MDHRVRLRRHLLALGLAPHLLGRALGLPLRTVLPLGLHLAVDRVLGLLVVGLELLLLQGLEHLLLAGLCPLATASRTSEHRYQASPKRLCFGDLRRGVARGRQGPHPAALPIERLVAAEAHMMVLLRYLAVYQSDQRRDVLPWPLVPWLRVGDDLLQGALPALQVHLANQVGDLARLGSRVGVGLRADGRILVPQRCVAHGVGEEGGLRRRRRGVVDRPYRVALLQVQVLQVFNEHLLVRLLLRVVDGRELVLVPPVRFGLADVSMHVAVETILLEDGLES